MLPGRWIVNRRTNLKYLGDLWNREKVSRNITTSCGHVNMQRCLTIDNINQNVIAMEDVVRGPVYERAMEIERELREDKRKPFSRVLLTSLDDFHGMGQNPLTFVRQVLAASLYAPLRDDSSFPPDIKEKVKILLSTCRGGGVGAYADPGGLEVVRKLCAEYISRRDGGIPSHWGDITVCSGAADAIRGILKLLVNTENGKKSAVLLPFPHYPFYSAATSEIGMEQVGYYLDEDHNWTIAVEELKRAIQEGSQKCIVRAIVVINPGNPTGQVMSRKTIENVIKFAYEENLLIMADEVYQDNIYADGCEFHSFKKVLTEMGSPYDKMQLASFNSCSKGYMGEGGLRGAYTELINVSPDVRAMYLKSIAAMLCPTVPGQVTVGCMVSPPEEGEPSYPLWKKERESLLESLRQRALFAADNFRSLDGVTCNPVQGAVYAFPRLHFPEGALRKAKETGLEPDEYYAFQLLENTGICVSPGSRFSQKEGTYHIGCTILPQLEQLKSMFEDLKKFHVKFMEEHSR